MAPTDFENQVKKLETLPSLGVRHKQNSRDPYGGDNMGQAEKWEAYNKQKRQFVINDLCQGKYTYPLQVK